MEGREASKPKFSNRESVLRATIGSFSVQEPNSKVEYLVNWVTDRQLFHS